MNERNNTYGELISSIEINYKIIGLTIFIRFFMCCVWWAVWFKEDTLTIFIVVLTSLPFLLFPLIHCQDKMELFENGLCQKNKFYSWEQIGQVEFCVYKPNVYQWLKYVKMSTNCKRFNVTYLENPMDTYQNFRNNENNVV